MRLPCAAVNLSADHNSLYSVPEKNTATKMLETTVSLEMSFFSSIVFSFNSLKRNIEVETLFGEIQMYQSIFCGSSLSQLVSLCLEMSIENYVCNLVFDVLYYGNGIENATKQSIQ